MKLCNVTLKSFLCALFAGISISAQSQTLWQVGPDKGYKTASSIANLVQKGDVVEIDVAVYENDVVNWSKDNLTIKGVNGRPHFKSTKSPSNGKAIWVVSGNQIKIENIEFSGCKVPDSNGAGIRVEGAGTIINKCCFHDNEMGILQGIVKKYNLTIEYSEFYKNGFNGGGYNHNVYIGNIDTLFFRFNYTHDALDGHELKSRAAINLIEYNVISNETTADGRTIDLPNGGCSVLIGNVITQSLQSMNYHILGYGMEGLNATVPNNLIVVNNTFVNHRGNGTFIQTREGTRKAYVYNNIFAGKYSEGLIVTSKASGALGTPVTPIDSMGNFYTSDIAAAGFNNVSALDLTLKSNSPAIGKASLPPAINVTGCSLLPNHEFNKSFQVKELSLSGNDRYDAGAYQTEKKPTNISEQKSDSPVLVSVVNGMLHISNPLGNPISQLLVTDISGRLIHRESAIGRSVYSCQLPFPNQVYIVKVNDGNTERVIKVLAD